MSKSEFLSERNSLLELLHELDDEIRSWHESEGWRFAVSPHPASAYARKMDQRHMLAQDLEDEYGCAPWPFDPSRDNSWLVRPQVSAA